MYKEWWFHSNPSEVFMLERNQMKPEYQSIIQTFSKLPGTLSRICEWIKILIIYWFTLSNAFIPVIYIECLYMLDTILRFKKKSFHINILNTIYCTINLVISSGYQRIQCMSVSWTFFTDLKSLTSFLK